MLEIFFFGTCEQGVKTIKRDKNVFENARKRRPCAHSLSPYSHIRQLQFAFRQKVLQQGSASSPDIYIYIYIYIYINNSLIIQEENTEKSYKRVVSLYVIKNHVNLHKP